MRTVDRVVMANWWTIKKLAILGQRETDSFMYHGYVHGLFQNWAEFTMGCHAMSRFPVTSSLTQRPVILFPDNWLKMWSLVS